MRKRTKVYKQILKNPCNEKLKDKIVEIERKILASHWSEKKNIEDKVVKACKSNLENYSYPMQKSTVK